MKERRTIEQIYYKMVVAIQENKINRDSRAKIKLTNVQLKVGLSYARALVHIKVLESYELITTNPLQITNKGCAFIEDYRSSSADIQKINSVYLRTDNSWKNFSLSIPKTVRSTKYENLSKEEVIDLVQVNNFKQAIIEELEA